MKPILEIHNVSKKFMINHESQPYLNLRDSISSIFKSKPKDEEFWAIKDISFNVMPGDAIGIIGKNGAGKSTLLKILSKITPPTSGKIIGRGRIASLLEVGTGFHSELSGRENIFMNGSILGMTRTEIVKNFDAIVDFSGVEKFIDTPLKHYSSGMQLRLAFAVAAFLENEILIIDEVLAVGDSEFQKKCLGKMEDVTKSHGRTVLFVSHNLIQVQNICNKAVLLANGRVENTGDSEKIVGEYLLGKEVINNIFDLKKMPRAVKNDNDFNFETIEICEKEKPCIFEDEELILKIIFKNNVTYNDLLIGVTVSNEFHTLIECRSTNTYPNLTVIQGNANSIHVKLSVKLHSGVYNVNLGARTPKGLLEYVPSVFRLEVLSKTKAGIEDWKKGSAGLLITNSEWSYIKS
jgi:lipopolysaccharide transport system ATP-binding protein